MGMKTLTLMRSRRISIGSYRGSPEEPNILPGVIGRLNQEPARELVGAVTMIYKLISLKPADMKWYRMSLRMTVALGNCSIRYKLGDYFAHCADYELAATTSYPHSVSMERSEQDWIYCKAPPQEIEWADNPRVPPYETDVVSTHHPVNRNCPLHYQRVAHSTKAVLYLRQNTPGQSWHIWSC